MKSAFAKILTIAFLSLTYMAVEASSCITFEVNNALQTVIEETDTTQPVQQLQETIFYNEVKPLLSQTPNWKKVDSIINNYPSIDGELIIGLSVIHYLNALAKKERNVTRNIIDAATIYDSRFKGGAYNTWAWVLFENTFDKIELKKALEWSKKALLLSPDNYNYIDTYANLLYKLGRRDEAIHWQQRAIELRPAASIFKKRLEKMKARLPTWPEQ